jgi:hypothetical protein
VFLALEMEWSHPIVQPVSFILKGTSIFKVVILTNVSLITLKLKMRFGIIS